MLDHEQLKDWHSVLCKSTFSYAPWYYPKCLQVTWPVECLPWGFSECFHSLCLPPVTYYLGNLGKVNVIFQISVSTVLPKVYSFIRVGNNFLLKNLDSTHLDEHRLQLYLNWMSIWFMSTQKDVLRYLFILIFQVSWAQGIRLQKETMDSLISYRL